MPYTPKPGVSPENRAEMAELARRSRTLCTAVQAEASQRNGSRGGRPKGVKDSKPRQMKPKP